MDEQIAQILLRIKSVTLNTIVPYKYASGLLSPIYIDCRTISSFPKERKIVIERIVEKIKTASYEIDVIVGSGHSGISLAAYLSERLKIPMAYTRKSKKSYGKGKQIEGIVKDGSSVLIVTDIVGTEGHIESAVNSLIERKCKIVSVTSIFSLDIGIVEEFLAKKKIKNEYLTDIHTLTNVATREHYISLLEKREIEKWLKNKQSWGSERANDIDKKTDQISKDVAEILLEIKGVTLNLKNPYTYNTGIRSPIYCDNRLLISYPKHISKIIDYMTNIIINHIGTHNIDVIGGTSTAGIPHAAILSERLNLPLIYIKGEPASHGKNTIIEGVLGNKQRVLIIEDLVSTGRSLFSAVETVRRAGGVVNDSIAIFSYQFKSADKKFNDINCKLYALSNFSTLLEIAEKKKYLKVSEKTVALEWNINPKEWGPKHGFPLGKGK